MLALLTFVSQAQPFGSPVPGYRIIRQDYTNTSGETGYSVYEYNREGQMIRGFWTLADNSRFSKNYYEYDEDGNLVTAIREFSEGRNSSEMFMYNSEGQKTHEYFYRSDSVTGKADYFYEDGRLVRAELDKYKGWLSGTILYLYDASGRRSSANLIFGEETVCRIAYDYDEAGNMSEERWDFNGGWNQVFTFIYERTGPKSMYYTSPYLNCPDPWRIQYEVYSFNGESGGPSAYFYSKENGLLVRKEFSRSDGLKTSTVYKYDEKRRLLTSRREYSAGGTGEFVYRYNEEDQLVARYYYMGDTLSASESYIYDSDGRLYLASLRNFDSWLTGIITFESDPSGKPAKGHFRGENGYDAELVFTYNSDSLLEELRWDFSFGKYQLYRFAYEQKVKRPEQ